MATRAFGIAGRLSWTYGTPLRIVQWHHVSVGTTTRPLYGNLKYFCNMYFWCKLFQVMICFGGFLKKCLPCFNELARFGQFIKYTHFLVPFFVAESPLLVPFHSKLGPHFEKFRFPSHVGAVTLTLSSEY